MEVGSVVVVFLAVGARLADFFVVVRVIVEVWSFRLLDAAKKGNSKVGVCVA